MRIRSIRNRPVERGANAGTGAVSIPISTSAMTETEAARYIGMSRAWLKKSRTRRFRAVTDAPPFVRSGKRRIVYRREDLDAWQLGHLERVGVDGSKVTNSETTIMVAGR